MSHDEPAFRLGERGNRYALEEEDFQVFRDLCEAFNALGKSQLEDPFGAEPFRYLHEDVELQDYPDIPGATWHEGHAGALQWTTNLLGRVVAVACS
jgi:hypothetical protein